MPLAPTDPDGLSAARKREIYTEEVYRDEVRAQIAGKRQRDRGERLMGFLNSGFGIFLCSTVFVSLFSFAYTSLRAAQQRRHAADNLAEKLDTEIAFRLASSIESRDRLRGYAILN